MRMAAAAFPLLPSDPFRCLPTPSNAFRYLSMPSPADAFRLLPMPSDPFRPLQVREKWMTAQEMQKKASEAAEEADRAAGAGASDARKASDELQKLQLDADMKARAEREKVDAKAVKEADAAKAEKEVWPSVQRGARRLQPAGCPAGCNPPPASYSLLAHVVEPCAPRGSLPPPPLRGKVLDGF